MAGHPSAGELVAAVREFLATLRLDGREAFHARVAANVLAIVERELAGEVAAVEAAALADYRHPRGPGTPSPAAEPVATRVFRTDGQQEMGPRVRGIDKRSSIAATVAAAIRAGTLTAATPGLVDALIAATCARLAVDNPRYPTLARLAAPAAIDAAARR